jgi:glucokinase
MAPAHAGAFFVPAGGVGRPQYNRPVSDPGQIEHAEPVLALDLGGTQLRTALVTADGRLVARRAGATPHAAAEAVVAACRAALQATLAAAKEAGLPAPRALGISAPGPLDPFRGEFLDPPNLDHSLWGFPLATRLGGALGLPATMAVDVHAAALAEGRFGAARGLTDYVYMTISTGVGGAVVSGGRLMRGPDGVAGELGHLTIDINGPLCGCGARGHLEALASGTGIARAARELGLGDLDAAAVAAAEQRGDATAGVIMERARAAFAAAMVSIVDVFNPRRVIVGGGIALGQGDRLLEPARQAVRKLAYRRQAERVQIVPAALGDDVGLIGALALVDLDPVGDDGLSQEVVPGAGHVALSTPPSAADDGPVEKDRSHAAGPVRAER